MPDKKCKCGETYTQYTTLQNKCPKCLAEIGRKRHQKEQKAAHKAFRAETRKRKEKLKTRSDHAKDVQALCNKAVRIRDREEGCISCNKPATWGGQWHASHYRPTGNCSGLRFHPMNIHKACSECNNHKSGNLSEYRIRLIQKIGLENVEWLESQNALYKWDIEDLKELKKYFRELLKEIEE